jgi:hypothetical protein
MSQQGNMGPHESSELHQPASVSDHSMCLVLPETTVYYGNMQQAISGACSQITNMGISVMCVIACGFYGI